MKKRKFFRILEFDHKKICWFLLLLFIISLIPILYLSGYDHAIGDDYGYGFRAHCAWLESHDLREVMRMALETARIYWHTWQGTWFTIFLMALQPEVFSPNAYWIVPWLMLAVNIGSTSLLLHYFMVRRLELSVPTFLCVDILLLMSMIQFFPSTKSGIFWYNGSVHYIIPYGLAMLAVYCFFGMRTMEE